MNPIAEPIFSVTKSRPARWPFHRGGMAWRVGLRALLAAGLLAAPLGYAVAQTRDAYPDKPVRMIVPFVAGASYDTIARIVAEPMTESFGQQVVVDNRPGASGIIGANLLAKAGADGYTLGMFGNNQTISSAVRTKLPYDLLKDFTPISRVAVLDNVFVVNSAVPVHTLKELIAYLKDRPGKIYYGSGGTAGTTHLAGELFKSMAGVNAVHVPYKGGGLAVTGLLSNEVQMMILNMISAEPQVKAGRLRALAIAAKTRSPLLPDVPTTDEAGLPGYEFSQWYGIVAPAPLPKRVLDRLAREVQRIAALPDVKAKMAHQGASVFAESPRQFAEFIKRDVAQNRKIATDAGIHVE